jgi:hypothetical protein
MTVDESIQSYGVKIRESDAPEIRSILARETALESKEQGTGDTELMKLCGVQLFSLGRTEDILSIWEAKTASMDADGSIDIQLLCGPGLSETKKYLAGSSDPRAKAALARIMECEAAGDFEDFSAEFTLNDFIDYFESEPE